MEDPDAEEEERRLFYVAVTRARDELYLCHPLLRGMPGQGLSLMSKSRFLGEFPVSLVEEWNLRPSAPSWGSPGSTDAASRGRKEEGSGDGEARIDPDPDTPF